MGSLSKKMTDWAIVRARINWPNTGFHSIRKRPRQGRFKLERTGEQWKANFSRMPVRKVSQFSSVTIHSFLIFGFCVTFVVIFHLREAFVLRFWSFWTWFCTSMIKRTSMLDIGFIFYTEMGAFKSLKWPRKSRHDAIVGGGAKFPCRIHQWAPPFMMGEK